MKVGILTFSAAFNFGAVLQCYGLYYTLKELGYNVKVIDYRPAYLATYKPAWGLHDILHSHIFSLVSRWTAYRYWRHIYDLYDQFERQNMLLTRSCSNASDVESIATQFDCIVVGSDQVWNPDFNNNDPIWYGSNRTPEVKWIGYAISAGGHILQYNNLFSDAIKQFSAIGVRELDLGYFLQQYTDKPIEHVIDPSLLASFSAWAQWTSPIKRSKYILVYQARKTDDVFRIARLISQKFNNIEIVVIDFWDNVRINGFKTYVASPAQFISLVKNAQCVITTSFHGTAFSIILGTSFYTLRLNDGADGRVENLLTQLGLLDRFIDAKAELINYESIDFSTVWLKLEKQRQASLNFLEMSLR